MWIKHPRKNGLKLKQVTIKFSPRYAQTLKEYSEREDVSYGSLIETFTTQSNNFLVQKKLSQFRQLYRRSPSSDEKDGETAL